MTYDQSSNTITISVDNIEIPRIFNNLYNSLSNTPLSSFLEDLEVAAPWRSTYSGTNQVDYKKLFKR